MSILLEALRKTEKQQRQPVPTIHSDEQGRPEPDTLRTGPLVAMIAVALVVSGWFTWRQYQLPPGVYQPPVTLTAGQASAAKDGAAQTPATPGQGAGVENKPATAPSNPLANNTSSAPRTPVETYQPPADSKTAAVNNASGSGTAAARKTNDPHTSGAGTRSPGGQASRQPVADAVAEKQETAHVPEPIGYWELPDAVRADVPDIRFSVLVYDKAPANRFVLVDGQRLAEGDSVQPGMLVNEIRRDGVVFSYRMYKFLVKR